MSDSIAFAASFELTGPPAPEWMHLLPFGTFFGRDGRGPYAVRNADHAKQIVAATQTYQRGADMPVDYEHQSINAAANGKPAPAAGWIKDLAIRADGVWGRVEWTAPAGAAIGAKEYRYVSPVFIHNKNGTELRIKDAALTNHPNLALTALASQTTKDRTAMPFARIAKALGLPETATEAEIAAAAQSRSDRLKELEAAHLRSADIPPAGTLNWMLLILPPMASARIEEALKPFEPKKAIKTSHRRHETFFIPEATATRDGLAREKC